MAIDTYSLPQSTPVPPMEERPQLITREQLRERLHSLGEAEAAEILQACCAAQWQRLAKESEEQGYRAGVQRAEQVLTEELEKAESQKLAGEQDIDKLKERLNQCIDQLQQIKPGFDEDCLVSIVSEACFRLVGEQLIDPDLVRSRIEVLAEKYRRRTTVQIALDRETYTLVKSGAASENRSRVSIIEDGALERGSVRVSFVNGEMEHSVREKAEEFFRLIDSSYRVVKQ